jgi:hypothetical protein
MGQREFGTRVFSLSVNSCDVPTLVGWMQKRAQ